MVLILAINRIDTLYIILLHPTVYLPTYIVSNNKDIYALNPCRLPISHHVV